MSEYITLILILVVLIPGTLILKKFFDTMDNEENKPTKEDLKDEE